MMNIIFALNRIRKSVLMINDSYKDSHAPQYPEGTEYVSSYIESRGGLYDEVVNVGAQMFVKDYLLDPITLEDIMLAKEIIESHGEPFNLEGWLYILGAHGGYLPVEIRAAPEGLVINNKNVVLEIVNTDPKCFWLTSYLETPLLRAIWYPSTVASVSFGCRRVIKKWLDMTGDLAGLDFKLHDFGARGVSSNESAMIGGLAHLMTGALGTDTKIALIAARMYYNENMAGFSIPASEHSTMTILGREGEEAQMRRMVERFAGPGKIYACVSDGYDIYNATSNIWGGSLRDLIISSGGTLVVRPDSGDPATVVLKVVKLLDEKFGSYKNDKGFKVLGVKDANWAVRVIQGDGINQQSIDTICMTLAGHGYSTDNIAFGMGGALLQAINRDTNKWAMKCSAVQINGVWHDVFKDPVTDQGKRSKKGRLSLVKTDSGYETVRTSELNGREDILVTIFKNGKLLVDETLAVIRARAIAAL